MVIGICYGFMQSSPIQVLLYHEASITAPDVETNNYGSIKNVLKSLKINYGRGMSGPRISYEQAKNDYKQSMRYVQEWAAC